jgi:hypothetical protein
MDVRIVEADTASEALDIVREQFGRVYKDQAMTMAKAKQIFPGKFEVTIEWDKMIMPGDDPSSH